MNTQQPGPQRRAHRQTALVLLMAVAMVGAAVVPARWVLADPPRGVPALPWWALAIGFAAAETWVVHIQVKRESRNIALGELPLVVGLFLASPLQLLIGRLTGSAAVMLLRRRSSPLKTVWNLAMFTLQTVVAVALFRVIAGTGDESSLLSWAGSYAGAIGANCLGTVALALVVAIYDGGLRPRQVLRNMVTGEPVAPLVVTLALIAVSSLEYSPHNAVLLLLAGAGVLAAYRAYAMLADRHLNLERLYRFSQAVSSAPEVDEILGKVLAEARELLHAERAEIAFITSATGGVAYVRLGGSGRLSHSEDSPSPEDEWLLARTVHHGSTLLLPRGTRDADHRRWLDAQAARDAVAVPLRGGSGILGALVVTDRLGDVRSFDGEDVLLLETVANHVGVALQNGELLDRLRHESVHDTLTGLPNRAGLQGQLAGALDDVADGRSTGAAVMILDLDGFKEINDTLGHQQGDAVLVEVAARLRAALGTAGLVARLGGDEFAVLLPGTADETRALRVGRRLLRALEQPIPLDDMEIEVGGSLGLALAPQHAGDPAGLLKRADMAMYDAKAATGGVRVYEPERYADNPRRLMLVSELRTALHQDLLEVHVQPQARLDTGRTVAVEALVRWHHPELGSVPPEEFVPIAERSGLVGLLTSRVLDRSLAAVAAWRAEGHDLAVSVNLSTRSLHDADLVDEVAQLLRRHDVPPSRLTLEVTEGSVMADPARATAVLHQLRGLGVRLSVDDFGTGYSSLSYLKRLPVQEVKIDRSFVTGLGAQSDDVAIVRAIVDLGRHLGLEVVAEGVEDAATWELLAGMGCDLVQGWHLAQAMPTDQLVPWLRSRAGASHARTALHVV